jgi:hypothetical protein
LTERRRPKAFRAQLLHRWLRDNHAPCRVADVGGGKGLLAYLLQQSGWEATVIDPHDQPLPDKYTDLERNRLRIDPAARVPRIAKAFEPADAADFDLLIGMHAHGSNMAIIDATASSKRDFILFPCCVIDEPIEIRPNVDWLESLVDYAIDKGHNVRRVTLPFAGQNVGIFNFEPLALR